MINSSSTRGGGISARRTMVLLLVLGLMAMLFAALVANPAEAKHRHHHKKVTTTPSTVSFGSVTVGQLSAPQDVTVKNVSTNPITITPKISGTDASDFLAPTIPITIAPGDTAVVPVTFQPTGTTGAKTGSLVLVDANNNTVAKVPLSGIAI